jgi:hypothetical protein
MGNHVLPQLQDNQDPIVLLLWGAGVRVKITLADAGGGEDVMSPCVIVLSAAAATTAVIA